MQSQSIEKFSVLMSVYRNDDPGYLKDSLQSLSDQSVLADEVVIVEDGPITKDLNDVIEIYSEILNVKSIKLNVNSGLASALNVGLKNCKNNLVARMDADDICHKKRFEKQLEFLKRNNEIDVVGGYVFEFKTNPNDGGSIRYVPLGHEDIVKFARRRSPVSHPTVLFKKSAVLAVGGYPNFRKAQDYALWSQMIVNGYRFANIQDVLLYMRCGDGLMHRRSFFYLKNELALIFYQYRIGFLSPIDFILNATARSVLRCSPNFLKKIFYGFMRG